MLLSYEFLSLPRINNNKVILTTSIWLIIRSLSIKLLCKRISLNFRKAEMRNLVISATFFIFKYFASLIWNIWLMFDI